MTPTDTHRRPSVSVVVPVHGDRGDLARALAALDRQTYPGPVEVLVADNGDNPGLAATVAAAAASVRVVDAPEPGSYAARNAALAHATGTVLAFTDADCEPEPHWLWAGIDALTGADTPTFVGGAVVLRFADPRHPSAGELWDFVYGLPQAHYVRDQGWAATANLFVTRETFDAVGPFDGRLRSGGDRDWGTRATEAGVACVFAPGAVVGHPTRDTRALRRKIRRVSRGWAERERAAGRPPFPSPRLLRSAVPYARSTVRDARDKVGDGFSRSDRARFVVVTLWLQYYRLGVQLRLVAAGHKRSGSARPRARLRRT